MRVSEPPELPHLLAMDRYLDTGSCYDGRGRQVSIADGEGENAHSPSYTDPDRDIGAGALGASGLQVLCYA